MPIVARAYNAEMKNRLVYVELKTGHADNGPAWIGVSGGSKTGATLYFNGGAFKRLKGSGVGANYFNIETGDEYWISGIKKDNKDRHWAGGGPVAIDRAIVAEYLTETGRETLPANLYLTDLAPPKQEEHHSQLEHRSFSAQAVSAQGSSIPESRNAVIKRKG